MQQAISQHGWTTCKQQTDMSLLQQQYCRLTSICACYFLTAGALLCMLHAGDSNPKRLSP